MHDVNIISKMLLHLVCRKYFSIAAATLLISQISFSQITFFKTYGDTANSHYDQGYAVLQTEDGGYIVAGETGFYHPPGTTTYYGDVYLIKTDEYGDTIWTKTYGDANAREVAYSMEKTSDGGYVVCAYSEAYWGLWLIKINSQGDSIWSKKYPVGKGNCIKQTNDGGYIITGSGVNGKSDIYLLKIDLQGDTLWLKLYDNSNHDEGLYVQQTHDGGYIIAGVTEFPAPRELDIRLIKTDAQGDTLWTKKYGGDYIDGPRSLCETKDGGYFVAGEYTEGGELGLEIHIWLLRTDSNGDTLWTKKINNGSWGDHANCIKNTLDGGFIVVGETTYESYDSDIYLVKLDEKGNYQWFSTIGRNVGGNGDEKHFRGNDVLETTDGGYIITGFKWFCIGSNEYQDLCLVKADNKGQITDVKEMKTNTPSNFVLLQNYPNPFNSETIIQFTVAHSSRVRIDVFDVLGRIVGTVLNSYFAPGQYSTRFASRSLSTGCYFYRMQANRFIGARKFVVIR